jgi:hypothetical protein
MKRTIKRIAPLQAGKMLGVLYACMGLIFLPIFMLAAAAGAFTEHVRSPSFFNCAGRSCGGNHVRNRSFHACNLRVMGFIFGVIGAAIYNLVAGWTGGIEVEVE